MSCLYTCTLHTISSLPHSCWSLLLRWCSSHRETPLTFSTPTNHCHTGEWRRKKWGEVAQVTQAWNTQILFPNQTFSHGISPTQPPPIPRTNTSHFLSQRMSLPIHLLSLSSPFPLLPLPTLSASSHLLCMPHPGYPPHPPLFLSLPFYGLVSSTWNVKWQTI